MSVTVILIDDGSEDAKRIEKELVAKGIRHGRRKGKTLQVILEPHDTTISGRNSEEILQKIYKLATPPDPKP